MHVDHVDNDMIHCNVWTPQSEPLTPEHNKRHLQPLIIIIETLLNCGQWIIKMNKRISLNSSWMREECFVNISHVCKVCHVEDDPDMTVIDNLPAQWPRSSVPGSQVGVESVVEISTGAHYSDSATHDSDDTTKHNNYQKHSHWCQQEHELQLYDHFQWLAVAFKVLSS